MKSLQNKLYEGFYKNAGGVPQPRNKTELQKEINDLTKQEFDNIVATYDKKLGITSGKRTLIQDDLALAEAKGEIIGSRYYTKQIALNNVDLRNYQSEREELSTKLLNFKPFSDEWYDARKKIFLLPFFLFFTTFASQYGYTK